MKNVVYKYHFAPLFLLLITLIIFYFPVLFLGRTLQGPEMARMNIDLKSPPSIQEILSGKIAPQIFNTEQATAAYVRFPNDLLMGHMYRSKEMPLWNSHQGIGTPFAAQYETSAFFPLRIIQNVFPSSARDLFFILHAWLAGIFTYLFFIRAGLNRISAFFGAALYMSSGVFSWFMQLEEYMSVAMMLPLLMLTTHQLSGENSAKNIAFLAFTTALMLLTGQPEAMFYAFILSGTYYLFRVYSTGKESVTRAKHLMTFFAASILGMLIASPLLVLFLQLLHHSLNTMIGNHESLATTPLFLLPAIVLPQLLDWSIMPITIPAAASWDFLGGYIGFIPLFFIIGGCLLKNISEKKTLLFYLIFGAAFLMLDIGAWPFNLISALPLFQQSWPLKWGGAAWNFTLISAATYGFYFLNSSYMTGDEWKKIINYAAILTILVLYVAIAITAANGYLGNKFIFIVTTFYQKWLQIGISGLFAITAILMLRNLLIYHKNNPFCAKALIGISVASAGYCLPKGDFYINALTYFITFASNIYVTRTVYLLIGLGFLSVIFFYTTKNKRTSILSGLLLLAVIFLYSEMTVPGYPLYTNVVKTTPFIDYLKKNAGYDRIFAFNGLLTPNYASVYGLYDIRFIASHNDYRYQSFIETYVIKPITNSFRQWFNGYNYFSYLSQNHIVNPIQLNSNFGKAISFLGVKYIIATQNENIDWMKKNYPVLANQLTPVYHDTLVNIYKNAAAVPRVFFVSNYVAADSDEKAQSIAMSGGFNPENTAVINSSFIPKGSNDNGALNATAKISEYSNNKIIISSETNKSALLILTDLFYPGWHATIDGKTTKIICVDGLVRGIFVPVGQHNVTFYYFPKIFKVGIILMIVSLLICIFLLFLRNNRNTKQ